MSDEIEKRGPGRPRKGSPRTWYIPDDTFAALDEIARDAGQTVPDVVREILADAAKVWREMR